MPYEIVERKYQCRHCRLIYDLEIEAAECERTHEAVQIDFPDEITVKAEDGKLYTYKLNITPNKRAGWYAYWSPKYNKGETIPYRLDYKDPCNIATYDLKTEDE